MCFGEGSPSPFFNYRKVYLNMDKRLIKRFLKNEKAPCDACNKNTYCKDNETACRVFTYYVNTGYIAEDVLRTPTKEIYIKLFEDEKPLNQIWNHIDESNNS